MNASTVERAADFVRRFESYWEAPTTEGLVTMLAENVHLEAPTLPVTDTLEDGQRAWGALLEMIPDLSATVHRWGATDDGVFIEFTLSGTLPTGQLSWSAVDRFLLGEDGLATERIAYFDSAPVVAAITGG